jgi:hypothetical protein
VDGLGSMALVVKPETVAPRQYSGRGIKGDWLAVGESVKRAMSRTK